MVWFGKELLACDFDTMQCCTAEGEGAMINGAAYYPLYAGRLLETVNACFNPYDAPIASNSAECRHARTGVCVSESP
ncbi:MAG: hypothetical protein ACLU3I_03245 [Acutalibacteraceae bacterium]